MSASSISKILESNFEFIMEICKHPDVISKKNLLISPFSVCTALSMVYTGTRNVTAEEMKSVLKLSAAPEDSDFHAAMEAVLDILKKQQMEGLSLHSANKLYMQENIELSLKFLNILQKHYQSIVGTVDFMNESEKARTDINKWVEEMTQQKIKDLLPDGAIDNMTRMVLVNALYFKGNWAKPFEKRFTRKAGFHVDSSKTVQIDMMLKEDHFNMAFDGQLACKILELPYVNENLCMLIILPDELNGLNELVQKLNYLSLSKLISSMNKQNIYLHVPKFQLECNLSLADILSQMGMGSLFSPTNADLSGLCSSQKLHVSAVVHKTFVEVNEEGTEAAAATAVGIALCCLPPTIKIDHPFIFLIQEKSSGIILFWGKMVDPSK